MVTKGGEPNNGDAAVRTTRASAVTARDTQKRLLIRQGWAPARTWCEQCGREVQTLTPEEAAAFKRTDLQTIDALMQRNALHRKESAEGMPLVCLNSLL